MGVIGGGLLVAVAAALWIAYLMPIWFRRRQYLATERNAVRLQQTLRILAETAETPEPVLIEANARQIALHQRALREQERTARLEAQTTERLAIAERRVAEAAADAAADAVAVAPVRHTPVAHASPTEPIEVVDPDAAASRATKAASAGSAVASRRVLRRRRALCSLLLLVGLLTAVGGLVGLAFGASPLVAVAGGAVVGLAVTALAGLARVRTTAPVAAPVARPVAEAFEPVELVADDERHEGWTPQPLPKPLTLSRGTIAATAMASIEAAAELQRVAQEAERAKRIDELATPVPTIAPAAQAAPAPAPTKAAPEPVSPYAGMGVVGEPQRRFGDLDAVLQRRRKVG